MADEVTTAQVDDLSGVAIQEARFTLQNLSKLADYITVKQKPKGVSTVRFPLWASMTAAALTEGNDIVNQGASTSSVEVSPTTNSAVGTVITDIALSDAPQTGKDIGKAAAMACIAKQNADIFALFDGFTNAVGSSNVDITEAVVREAKKILLQQSLPPETEIFMVLTPEPFEDLMGLYSLNTNNTSDVVRDAVYRGEAPPIYGVRTVLHTSGVDESGDVKCGMFARSALCMGVDWDVDIELGRRTRAKAWDFIATMSYAVAELTDLHGVEMLLDGAD